MTKCLKDGKICLKIKRKISWILIALKSLTKAITVKKICVHRQMHQQVWKAVVHGS